MRKPHIKNLTQVIIFLQVVTFFLLKAGKVSIYSLVLSPTLIIQGEVWRIVSFLLIPLETNPVWAFFSWYLLYIMGTALEHTWGEFKYNIYILIPIVLNNILAFVFGLTIVSNYYLLGSITLAFAFLVPDFRLMLFFIIPVKIKWIALITWLYYLLIIVLAPLSIKLEVGLSVVNFLIFFYRDIYYKVKYRGRVTLKKIERVKPKHICSSCGVTDLQHPEIEFRYCGKCDPPICLCENCIENHHH